MVMARSPPGIRLRRSRWRTGESDGGQAEGDVWEDLLRNGLPRPVGRDIRNGLMEIHRQEAGSDRHHLLCDSDGSIRGVPSGSSGSHNENGVSSYDTRNRVRSLLIVMP